MIVLGVILLLVAYLLLPRLTGIPLNVETKCIWRGWILMYLGRLDSGRCRHCPVGPGQVRPEHRRKAQLVLTG